MNADKQKRLVLLVILAFGAVLIPKMWHEAYDRTTPRNTMDPIPVGISGHVVGIDQGRGLDVKLDSGPEHYNLAGACNSSTCLTDFITFGDSIHKDPGSRVIRLIRGGNVTEWYLGRK